MKWLFIPVVAFVASFFQCAGNLAIAGESVVKPASFSDYLYSPLSVILIVLIAAALIYHLFNRQLRLAVSNRTDELNALTSEYMQILDHMQDAYYRADLDGNILWVSAAAERQLGYSRQSMIGTSIEALYYEEGGREKFLAALKDSGGQLQHYEICLKHLDGSPFWAEVNSHYCYDDQGDLSGVEGNVRDINERKLAQQESEELTSQLQQAQKMESIGVLAGGIAHDFNNLLVSVMGNTELALLDAPEDGDHRYYLKQVYQASKKGADLVRQMLAYSGQGRFEMGVRNLNQLITEVSELLGTVVGKKVQLELGLEENLANVMGDKNQLTQMLMNLMTNAAEAMEGKPGTVRLRTGSLYMHRDDFSQMYLKEELKEGKFIYVEACDSGCGMDRETQQRIFDPFFTTKESGSGLGLAALLGIVRGHGGALALHSEPGRGSCFKIYFPALDGEPVEEKELQTGQFESPALVHGTVLLVDDEEAVREVAARILKREGLKLFIAEDGKHGVELFRKHHSEISLVLLDLTMPEMDGEQAFKLMREIRNDIPILLSSGFPATKEINRLHGLAGFVRKPYTRKRLLQAISQAESH